MAGDAAKVTIRAGAGAVSKGGQGAVAALARDLKELRRDLSKDAGKPWKKARKLSEKDLERFAREMGRAKRSDELLAGSQKVLKRLDKNQESRLNWRWREAQEAFLRDSPEELKDLRETLAEIEGVNKLDQHLDDLGGDWTIRLPNKNTRGADAIAIGPGGQRIGVEIKSHGAGGSPMDRTSRPRPPLSTS